VRLYNDTYTTPAQAVRRLPPDLPRDEPAITLRQHQRDAVWRCMSSGNTLLAHVVGAGKSAVMARRR